jgi:hypothetical protein
MQEYCPTEPGAQHLDLWAPCTGSAITRIFDLLRLQLQLQSDDDREPATLIRPNALDVELSAVRNGKSRCGDDEAVASGMPVRNSAVRKFRSANNLSPSGLGPQG